MVTINSGETATSAVELVSNTYASSSASTSSRKKRAADNIVKSYPVYVAVKAAAGDQSLEATVKATGSNTRSVSALFFANVYKGLLVNYCC